MRVDGSGLTQIPNLSDYSCHSPKWSPDGKEIAFDFRRPGEALQASQVAVVGGDGKHFRVLAAGGYAGWSLDGKQCVYHTYGSPQSVAVIGADGRGMEILAAGRAGPRWLADGNHIGVMGSGGLSILDLATGRDRAIATINWVYPGYSFSNDGRCVVFGKHSGGLYLATFDQQTMQAKVRTIAEAGKCYGAAWSADDKRVVVSWRQNEPVTNGEPMGNQQLYTFEPNGDLRLTLLAGQDTGRSNKNPDWSCDGTTIVFSSAKRE